MCIDQTLYGKIRYLHQVEHLSQRQIAKQLMISRHTVEKYMNGATMPSVRKPGSGRPTIVTPEMLEFIKACIKEDIIEKLPKQKHTAHRIYVRLVDEMGYTGSECTVQRRVAQIRDDIVIVPYQMLQFNIKLALFQCGCGASFSAVLAQFLLMLDGAIILMLWYGFY